MDLWGPAQVESLGGDWYHHLHHDMYSAEECVTFLKNKSDTFNSYQKYEAWVKKQQNPEGIKCLGSDGGGEFVSKAFTEYLAKASTICNLTVHDSPQSNGVAERSNCTHLEQAWYILIATGLPCYLWAKAVRHSTYSCITWWVNTTWTCWFSEARPQGVLEWGLSVWVKELGAGKLDPYADEGCFVGHDEEAKGYQVYWVLKWRVSIEQDIYVDKGAALSPGDVVFEGEWDIVKFWTRAQKMSGRTTRKIVSVTSRTLASAYVLCHPIFCCSYFRSIGWKSPIVMRRKSKRWRQEKSGRN